MKNSRQIGIDLIKILATVLVIMVHHFNTIGFYDVTYNTQASMIVSTQIYIITLTCVPLFLISTGYLLSDREPSINHYKKLIFFIFEVLIIYIIGILLVLIYNGRFSLVAWYSQVKFLLKNPAYYVGLYISTYLIAPFINRMIKGLEENESILFLILVIFIISLPVFLNTVLKVQIFDTRPSSIWAILYYIIGVYINIYQPRPNNLKLFVLLVFVSLSYSLMINHYLQGGVYSHLFGYYQNPFALVIATILFLLIYKLQVVNIFLKKIIIFLSSSTMTFYLFSGLFSDAKAMQHIKLTNTLIFDIPSLITKPILSMLYSLPLALLIYIINLKVKNIIKMKNNI